MGRFKRGADLEHNQMILLEPLMELKFNDPEIVMMSLLAGDRKWKKQKGGKKKSSTHTFKKSPCIQFRASFPKATFCKIVPRVSLYCSTTYIRNISI